MNLSLTRTVRAVLVLVLAALTPQIAAAQGVVRKTLTATTCPGDGCVSLGVEGYGSATVQMIFAGTATALVEGSLDGVNFVTLQASGVGGSGNVTSMTGSGAWAVNVAGMTQLRVRLSAYTNPVIVMAQATRSGGGASGGGGGGGGDATAANQSTAITSLQLLDNLVLAEDAIHSSTAPGLLPLAVRNDAGTALAADGDYIPITTDSTGAVRVTGGGGGTQYTEADTDTTLTGNVMMFETNTGTSAVGAVSSTNPLPVTATDLDVQSGGADILSTTAFNSAFGTAGSADAQVLSIQGITSMTPVQVSDGGGSITVDGSISCSNCTGSGASDVDDSSFTIATDSVAPAGFLFDDVTPDSVDEGDVGLARMSSNRVPYSIIRDGASGAERGVSVTANNELLVELGAGSATIGVLGAGDNDIGNVDLELAGTAVSVSNPVAVRLSNGSSFVSPAQDMTIGSAFGTTGPAALGIYADFDGSAIPTTTNVDTEGEAVPFAASIKGVQYHMLVNEDASLQYFTSTTPGVVSFAASAANGADLFRSIDLDETEEDIKTSAGTLYRLIVNNTATSTRFIKCYNAAAASVTVGTTTPVFTFAVPGNSADDVAGNIDFGPTGYAFSTALSCAATTGVADNDTGAPGANEVIVNAVYK